MMTKLSPEEQNDICEMLPLENLITTICYSNNTQVSAIVRGIAMIMYDGP